MCLVDSVGSSLRHHPDVATAVERAEIQGGAVVGLAGPGGSTFVFDQPDP